MALRDWTAKVLLAGYAGFEIIRGAVPELLSVGFSVAVAFADTSLAVETLVEAGFLLVAFYVFTPEVFPATVERRRAPGFRSLVAVVSLTFALPASLALSTFDTMTVPYALVGGYFAAAVVVGLLAIAVYFRGTQSEPLWDPDGAAMALAQARAEEPPADHRRYLRRLDAQSRWAGDALRLLSIVAGAATYLGPCLLFGFAAATLGSLFPLLELLVVAGLLVQAGRHVGVVDRSVPDLEARFYDRLTATTRSVRGTASVLMIVVGVLLATFLILLWVRAGLRLWDVSNAVDTVALSLDPTVPSLSPLEAVASLVAAVGGVVALPIASGYAIWYWVHQLRWVAAVERGDDARRPPGLLLAATGLTGGWFVYFTAYRFEFSVDAAFAVAWPLFALFAVRNVRRMRRTRGTASRSRWPLLVAFTLYVGVVTGSLSATFDLRRSMVLGTLFPLWLYFLGELRGRTSGPRGRLLRFGYGVALFLIVFALREPLEIGLPLLAALGGVGALLLAGQAFAHAFRPSDDD
jgi:hypothetical protein